MTKSLITLPSERYEIYEKQLAEKDHQINQITAEKDYQINQITAEKDYQINQITVEKDNVIAEKDAQIQALLKQLEKINNK